MSGKKIAFLFLLFFLATPFTDLFSQAEDNAPVIVLNLDQCISMTLKNNLSRTASTLGVRAAEAQVRQARSGSFPKVDLNAGYLLMDQNPNFIFPAMSVEIPPINMGTFSIVPGAFAIPSQNIKLADNQTVTASIEFLFPLYTGGKISSYISQAEAALEIAKSDAKGNDQQIIFETKKLFYATLLTIKLEEIASEAYERLNSTLNLTESTYLNGSGKVTKSDYLKNKTVTEAVKSIWIQIEGENKNALAALAHAMGLGWKTRIKIEETEFPPALQTADLESLINTAIEQNPLFTKAGNGLKAFESKIDLARSEMYPSVAFFGSYKKLFNSYDYGMTTPDNKNLWMIGIGVQLNIFDGFKTSGMIDQAKANYDLLNTQKQMLTNGISLKVQYLYNKLETAKKKESASREAMQAAVDDRDLVEKAYFSDIMELKDLIQAQITESLMKAQYETAKYEWTLLQAEMNLVLANEKY